MMDTAVRTMSAAAAAEAIERCAINLGFDVSRRSSCHGVWYVFATVGDVRVQVRVSGKTLEPLAIAGCTVADVMPGGVRVRDVFGLLAAHSRCVVWPEVVIVP